MITFAAQHRRPEPEFSSGDPYEECFPKTTSKTSGYLEDTYALVGGVVDVAEIVSIPEAFSFLL